MKLSIVVPSNRTSMRSRARLLQICTFAGKDVEVIIRDNSNDPDKAEFLSKITSENCRVVLVPPCGPKENFDESLKMATGDFVLFAGDDDFIDEKAISAILHQIGNIGADSSIVGITGDYIIERASSTGVIKYPPLDSWNVEERCRNFIDVRCNLIFYSAIRTSVCREVLDFVYKMPFTFAYRDWVYVLILLISGRWVNIGRAICYYDFSDWEAPGAYFLKNIPFFKAIDVDVSIIHLQELLPCLEGCLLAQSPLFNRDVSKEARAAVTRMWYGRWHQQFAGVRVPQSGTEVEKIAIGLREKWLRKTDISFPELLDDLTNFMSIHSPKTGAMYKAYWGFFLDN